MRHDKTTSSQQQPHVLIFMCDMIKQPRHNNSLNAHAVIQIFHIFIDVKKLCFNQQPQAEKLKEESKNKQQGEVEETKGSTSRSVSRALSWDTSSQTTSVSRCGLAVRH